MRLMILLLLSHRSTGSQWPVSGLRSPAALSLLRQASAALSAGPWGSTGQCDSGRRRGRGARHSPRLALARPTAPGNSTRQLSRPGTCRHDHATVALARRRILLTMRPGGPGRAAGEGRVFPRREVPARAWAFTRADESLSSRGLFNKVPCGNNGSVAYAGDFRVASRSGHGKSDL